MPTKEASNAYNVVIGQINGSSIKVNLMRSRRNKPDLFTIVAIIVGIGVVITMKAQASWETKGSQESKTAQAIIAEKQSRLNPFIR